MKAKNVFILVLSSHIGKVIYRRKKMSKVSYYIELDRVKNTSHFH